MFPSVPEPTAPDPVIRSRVLRILFLVAVLVTSVAALLWWPEVPGLLWTSYFQPVVQWLVDLATSPSPAAWALMAVVSFLAVPVAVLATRRWR